MNKFINTVIKNPQNLILLLLSLAILIVGSFFMNFFLCILLVLLVNLIWIIPYVKNKIETMEPKEKESSDDMTKRKNPKKKRKGKIALLVLLGIFIVLLMLSILFFIFIAVSADKFSPDKLYTKEASTLYDKDGKQFAQ